MCETVTAAIYLDAENVLKTIDLQHLMKVSIPAALGNDNITYRRKLACGNITSMTGYKKQLNELDFTKLDTSTTVSKKNRADLKITVEAMESLLQEKIGGRPAIDLYIFITSDSDFTVVMKKLIEYGKKVFIVMKKDNADKAIFENSSTKVLFLDDNLLDSPLAPEPPIKKRNPSAFNKCIKDAGFIEGYAMQIKANLKKLPLNERFSMSQVRDALLKFGPVTYHYKKTLAKYEKQMFDNLIAAGFVKEDFIDNVRHLTLLSY